jgi:hypothetical protein
MRLVIVDGRRRGDELGTVLGERLVVTTLGEEEMRIVRLASVACGRLVDHEVATVRFHGALERLERFHHRHDRGGRVVFVDRDAPRPQTASQLFGYSSEVAVVLVAWST